MTRFFPKLYLDISSFWFGAILVVLLLVVFLIYRKRLVAFFSRTIKNLINFRESLSVTSDSDYIQVLYKYVQGLHALSEYFPLDKVLVPGKCIAPPPFHFPGKESLDTSLVQQVVGYDPLLPQLNPEFFGPTFPLIDAVQTNTNICLAGYPGTGKTTAIAECIASLITPEDSDDLPEMRIPFYVHAHHLLAQFPGRDILGILLKALQSNKAFLTIPNFPKYLTSAIQSDRSILFIDDMDCLSLDEINQLANFISALRTRIPGLQIIATASPSCLGNLVRAPLEHISISPWGNAERYAFLDKLSKLWSAIQYTESQDEPEDYSILSSMLVVSGLSQTPLEFTLRAISAYGGDIGGSTSSHAIEAYINRFPGLSSDLRSALELTSLFCIDKGISSFSRKELSSWFDSEYQKGNKNPAAIKSASFQAAIQAGVDANILIADPDNKYHFRFSTIAGIFGARGVTGAHRKMILSVLESPDWSQVHECMRYFSIYNNIKPLLKPFLNDQGLLKNKLWRASLWLEHTSPNSPEETALLKRITGEIHTNPLYLIKLRFTYALSRSKNPQIKSIFQHLLKSSDADTRRAASVGLGLTQDLTAVPILIKVLNDSHPSATAACYSLGKIGSPRSLEAIADALLHGNELLRRAAAESLSQNRSEGHPALREGATMDDLLVRYAVVHGLSMINESWALEILDTMRIDEKEWVVRDLAQQAFEILEGDSPYLPQDTPPPHEAAWLHGFASRQELPQPTDENALELLLKALEIGLEEEKQNALAHLARTGKEEIIPKLLEIANTEPFEIAHQAILAIWHCAPQRFNLFS